MSRKGNTEEADYPASSLRSPRFDAGEGIRTPTGWCEVDGARVGWRCAGLIDPEMQPIVCLNDIGGESQEYDHLLARCPVGSQLILVDWSRQCFPVETSIPASETGSQFSLERSTSLLQGVLNQLALRRPILLSCGIGAVVAIRYAAEHSARIAGLVLCQPAGLVKRSDDKVLSRLQRLATEVFGELPLGRHAKASRIQALRQTAARRAMAQTVDALEADLYRSQTELRAMLAGLSCPILFALSRQSHQQPLGSYLKLLDALLASAPQHRFTVFSGSFNPIWDEPERFAQALTGFVQALLPFEKHHHAWILTAVDWPTGNSNLWKCVHPSCPDEKILPSGQNANDISVPPQD